MEVNSQKKHIKNVIKLKIHIEMQESKLIYNHCSSFDEIFYGYPNQSRRDFNLPGYIEFLHEFENPLYLGIQNNPIDNIKIKYLSKNEEGEEAQGEEGEEENDYSFADNNDNSEKRETELYRDSKSLQKKYEQICRRKKKNMTIGDSLCYSLMRKVLLIHSLQEKYLIHLKALLHRMIFLSLQSGKRRSMTGE